jgi:hypothetical protein
MYRDPIVTDVDEVRRELLATCGDDLIALLRRMADVAAGRPARVCSLEELDRRFPAAPVDDAAAAALGEPWRDPIVEEVHRARERLSQASKAGEASVQAPSSRKAKSA